MDKILIVDDDPDILTLMHMTLTMHGYEVEAISQWENVDSSIESFAPDLVLLDVSLGGADGREICKRIKSTDSTKHIPVILFSANVEMEKSVHDCYAQAFISKPYNLQHLLKTIKDNIAHAV
ncbi:MAG TPA: response regulator [Ferruginibacter sp.]|nr:response regulator [Ferruginibacter sp.]